MAVEPEPYHPIRPGLDLGLLAARRMGPASWLTQADKEPEAKGAPEMANATCIEPGCKKFRVKNKRCTRHNKEHQERVSQMGGGSAGLSSSVAAAEPAGALTLPSTGKSLLSSLGSSPAARDGALLVLDFSGQEDLLIRAQSASDDLQRDIFALLRALLDGKLLTADESVLEG